LPEDTYQSKNTIIENICSIKRSETETDAMLKEYESQTEDLRILTYNTLIERFNEKYDTLNLKQKNLLREYINNISNTNNLREYVNTEIETVTKNLKTLVSHLNSDVVKIKINEAVTQLQKVKKGGTVKDLQVESMLMAYQLEKEIAKVIKNG
jgi:hypothetical protein